MPQVTLVKDTKKIALQRKEPAVGESVPFFFTNLYPGTA
jgi:hypothetical protein